jgi:hypothetical protein
MTYKVFKKHKDILDKMPCDLLRRIYLRNIYKNTSNYFLHIIADPIQELKFKTWTEQLNQEIWSGIKGTRIPLVIETY